MPSVGVSRSHLYRVFMSNVGQSPIDYLTSYRISEACSLLKNSSLSIAEIAVSVGFFDQFYFSRVFKKVKGVRLWLHQTVSPYSGIGSDKSIVPTGASAVTSSVSPTSVVSEEK